MVAFALVIAYVKYWGWQIMTKLCLGLIYLAVIAEGLRYLIPPLGQKLWKIGIPGLDMLRDYESLYRLDLAMFFSLGILIAVFQLWVWLLQVHLFLEDPEGDEAWNSEKRVLLITWLAATILGGDAILFYVSMCQVGWGGGAISLSALVATAVYVAVLVFVSMMTIVLRRNITVLKGIE